ncbi:MAG: hybrid sensor histidine kinase/response regulator [Calditrichaeota bacterium]|nr:MAG: hybrid sensor histidine kinase/response regulator [Calditrichota bacterium]
MQKKKILLVDDDPLNLDILREILENEYDCKEASCGEAALRILSDFTPDLILLDIMMPGIDGYKVCHQIRQDRNFRNIKIVLVSGKTSLEERLLGYECGADDYITKPFVDDELLAKVKVFLRLKHVEEMEQLKGDLLTLFSHETRTPISGIIGAADLLRDTPDLPEPSTELLEIIIANGRRLLDFVEKAKLLLNLKSGQALSRELAQLKEHVSRSIKKVEKHAGEKRISVVNDIGENLNLALDWPLVDKVFEYVLDNAVKFAPDATEVQIRQNVNDKLCTVQIIDAGGKLDDEQKEDIFNEFSVNDLDHHQRGQGLSLAIVRHVMNIHGGKIDVSVVPGKETTFNLSFPLKNIQPD